MEPKRRSWCRLTALCCVAVAIVLAGGDGAPGLPGVAGAAIETEAGGIEVRIEPQDVGLGGLFRPGSWTPIRSELANRSMVDRQVRATWLLEDVDGDEVHARVPAVTLGAGDPPRSLWLYAAPRINTTEDDIDWRLTLTDNETAQLLAVLPMRPEQFVPLDERVIGIVGPHAAGLDQYRSTRTQHEGQVLLEGIDPRRLPDRWYGMEMMQAMVWTTAGGDPRQEGVPEPAIREWVRRGGHLVISFGGAGDLQPQAWQEAAFLSDLWPEVELVESTRRERAPEWLGRGASRQQIPMRGLRPKPGSGVDVLLTGRIDGREEPLAVTHAFGRGRVTVIGVDLGAEVLVDAGLPEGAALWRAVFGWLAPVYPVSEYDRKVQEGQFYGAEERAVVDQGRFIASRIAMRDTVSPPLTIAILLFLAYGFIAGPLSFSMLRARGRTHLSWPVFVALVALFAAVAWGGAVLMRPVEPRVAHISSLTIDLSTGHLHTRSWMSLFLPRHGPVEVVVDPYAPQDRQNLVFSSAIVPDAALGSFVDPQSYALDSRDPGRIVLPMRATARQLEVDYLGHVDDAGDFVRTWGAVEADVHVDEDGRPAGTLVHRLPVELRDLVIVHSMAGPDAPVPQVWMKYDEDWQWRPGEPLDLEHVRRQWPDQRLYDPPREGEVDVRWEGWLGAVLSQLPGADAQDVVPWRLDLRDHTITRQIELLSFYGALPPPPVIKPERPPGAGVPPTPPTYRRPVGRPLDLSHTLAMNRLIVIGHVRGEDAPSPLPLPLTADGQRIERFDRGSRTVVRIVIPLERAADTQQQTDPHGAGSARRWP